MTIDDLLQTHATGVLGALAVAARAFSRIVDRDGQDASYFVAIHTLRDIKRLIQDVPKDEPR